MFGIRIRRSYDAGMREERVAEISVQEIVQPAEVLYGDRIVQAVGLPDSVDLRLAHVRPRESIHRVVGGKLHEDEADHRDQEQKRDCLQDPLRDVFCHVVLLRISPVLLSFAALLPFPSDLLCVSAEYCGKGWPVYRKAPRGGGYFPQPVLRFGILCSISDIASGEGLPSWRPFPGSGVRQRAEAKAKGKYSGLAPAKRADPAPEARASFQTQ